MAYGENEWDKLQKPDPQKGSAVTAVPVFPLPLFTYTDTSSDINVCRLTKSGH